MLIQIWNKQVALKNITSFIVDWEANKLIVRSGRDTSIEIFNNYSDLREKLDKLYDYFNS